jgi:hypothetical protein
MKPQPLETDLLGKWIFENGKMRGDATCERIEWLTKYHLLKVAKSREWGDWESLFQDPDDGRFWERTFPQSHMQGGGPPRLRAMSSEEAHSKYQFD